ncbi:MAG: twin-arginine translocation signal domain-containing protein [Olsenella sp.]
MSEQTRLNTSANMDEPTDLSRRDFLKGAVGVTLAIAVVSAGLSLPGAGEALGTAPQRAYAATATSAGTYTITANLYVDKKDTPIGKHAYVTNSGNPPFHKPTSPVSDNAKLQVTESGKKLLTVPIVNNTFGVLSIATTSTNSSVKVIDKSMTTWRAPWPWSTPYKERISSITFDVTNFSGGNSIADFTPCAEYATFPLYKGDKHWDLHLIVNFNSAKSV